MELIMDRSFTCSSETVYSSRKCYVAKTWKSLCSTLASLRMRLLGWLQRGGLQCHGLHTHFMRPRHWKVLGDPQNLRAFTSGDH